MKLYKCKVRITRVDEGIEIMEAPSEKIAKDPAWVMYAEKTLGYLEGLEEVKKSVEVTGIEEITDLGQVADKWKDSLPWYHPKHNPENEQTIKERLSPEIADNTAWIKAEVDQLENQKQKLEGEIKQMRALLLDNIEYV